MIFESFVAGGCKSYLVGCETSRTAALIDPELSLIDRYTGFASREGVQIRHIIDTHTSSGMSTTWNSLKFDMETMG